MGVDFYAVDFLLSYKGSNLGDTLCLGRQGLHLSPGTYEWGAAEKAILARDPQCQLRDLVAADGFSEKFFQYLGCKTVCAMDASPFEGAELIQDLNYPVPEKLHRRFDFIFDGGTIEHIFNFPVAIASVQKMLRPGGLYIGINGANNQLGHGLYQFSPELMWSVFSSKQGFDVERMALVACEPGVPPVEVVRTFGVRQEIGRTPHVTYLMVAARRNEMKEIDLAGVFQSDYEAQWNA